MTQVFTKYNKVLLVILILASMVRFYRLETKMRFIWDEGRDMLVIRRMIVDKDLTLLGPFNEIDGKKDFFGVFHYYLMAPSLWLADYNPLGPAMFTALLGVVSVGLVYVLLSLWADKVVTLITTAIYAFSPLVVKYVQWPWNPNTTPFFGLLFFLALTKLSKTKQLRWSLLSGAMLGVLIQLHYFTLAVVVSWMLVVLFLKLNRKKTLIHTIIFVAAAIIPNLSFVIFDLKHEFFLSKILLQSIAGGSSQQILSWSLAGFMNIIFNQVIDVSTQLFFNNYYWGLIIGWGLMIISLNSLRSLYQTKTLSLAALVSISWVAFLIQISFFPSTANIYHSAPWWFGLIYLLTLAAVTISKSFMNRRILVFFVLIILGLMIKAIDLGREPSWDENMPKIRKLSNLVAADAKYSSRTFNIAAFTDSNTKGVRYRYFLDVANVVPLGIDQYSQAEVLYVISPHFEEHIKQGGVWELETFTTGKITLLGSVDKVNVYKVEKKSSSSQKR